MTQTSVADNPYTRRMAEFISGLRYETVPPEVMHRLKFLILDSFGCALYGAALEWSRILQRRLGELDSTPACVVWGTNQKMSGPHAALVNGSQIQGFEIDDVHMVGMLHVGAIVLPPLMPIAEMHPGMSGKEFMTAAVAGYEIGPRIGLCMGNEHVAQGWHSGATFGVFGAAAAAARGLKLDADKTVHALGIAGTQASGLIAAQYGSMVKRMHAGRASQSGLYGAELADAGFTGILNVFESEYGGFCTTFSRSNDRFRLDGLIEGFGTEWQTMNTRLKIYSCNGSIHSTLDAIKDLQAQHPFGPNDVDHITVHAANTLYTHVGWKYVPLGITSAQFSLAYCVATLLLEGQVFVDQFTQDKLTDPGRVSLSEKIQVIEDDEITAKGSKYRQMVRVNVYLKDGTHLERTLEMPKTKKNIASEEQLIAKFDNLASHVLPKSQVEQLRDATLNMDKLSDAAQLARLMAVK